LAFIIAGGYINEAPNKTVKRAKKSFFIKKVLALLTNLY